MTTPPEGITTPRRRAPPVRAWRPTAADLAKLRETLELTQERMARKLGMSQRNYWRCENGQVAMSDRDALERFRRLAVPLGIVARRDRGGEI